MRQIEIKLEEYLADPTEPMNSFNLGLEYELVEQYASAMGYYLKAAELTDDDKLAYECLLRKAMCYKMLPDRWAHVRINCLHAISLMPERPEAYHLLSVAYEATANWIESYAWAKAGQRLNGIAKGDTLITDVQYAGYYALRFQQAVAEWHLGRFQTSIDQFKALLEEEPLNNAYIGHCKWNVDHLEGRDADAIAGIKNSKSITDKDEIIAKILEKQQKK
tara:strand:- start:1393 stop:2052 length:660 start_codon:yes stop_codon:yes gene_type:complete